MAGSVICNLDEKNRLPQPDRDCSLHEVIKNFGASLRLNGPDDEIDVWSINDESFRRLVNWARESGRFY